MADARDFARPVTLQPQYNLLAREVEWEIVPACSAEGLGLFRGQPSVAVGSLVSTAGTSARRGLPGWVRTPTGSRGLRSQEPDGAHLGRDRRVHRVSEARGASMAQVALAWLVDRPTVTSVVLGARTVDQLEDDLRAAGLHLSPAETEKLDTASDPGAADLLRRARCRAAQPEIAGSRWKCRGTRLRSSLELRSTRLKGARTRSSAGHR